MSKCSAISTFKYCNIFVLKAGVIGCSESSFFFAKESPFLQVQADLTLLPLDVKLQFRLLLSWWYSDLPPTFNSTWSLACWLLRFCFGLFTGGKYRCRYFGDELLKGVLTYSDDPVPGVVSRGQSYKANFGINNIKNGLNKLNFTLNHINFDVIYAKKVL